MNPEIMARAVEAAAKANFDRYTDHPHGDAWEETPEQVKAIWRGGVTEPVTAALAEVESSLTAERDRLAERLDKLLGVADEDGVTYPPNEFQRALRRYAAFEYDNLAAERDDLAARVARVEALHVRTVFGYNAHCEECGTYWPCPTIEALRGEFRMTGIDPAEVAAQVCECRKGAFNPYADPHCAVHQRPWPCSVLLSTTEAIRAALEQAWSEGYDAAAWQHPDLTFMGARNPYAKGGKS